MTSPDNTPCDKDHKRLLFLGIFLFFLFSLIWAQFFRIQVIDGDRWNAQAMKQHFFVAHEEGPRGSFFSRPFLQAQHPYAPQKLVVEMEKYHLHADPAQIPPHAPLCIGSALQEILDWSGEKKEWAVEQMNRTNRDRCLAKWLTKEQRDAVENWWMTWARQEKVSRNALFFVVESERSYPYGAMLGQVLHTVQKTRNEKTHQPIPTGGLEWAFHDVLSAKPGKKRYRRSPRHSFETGEVLEEPRRGGDVYLTIDLGLQAIAEEEIERGVQRSHSRSGWAVIMEPHTGEILALAQYPAFFPPDYPQYFADADRREDMKVKGISDAIEPGSVMKPITMAIALSANRVLIEREEKPLFDPEEKVATANGKFPGRAKPISDVTRHAFLNMDMAIKKSSNVYVGRLAERIIERLGKEWYRDQLENVFGFGKKTGIELPGETAGVLPKPGRKHPNGKLEWSTPTPFSLAMGYNIQTNTLQLLQAFAILVNGGYFVQPTLIDRVIEVDDKNEPTTWYYHRSPAPHVLDAQIGKRVVQALEYVTKPGGSGRRGAIGGYTEFGKSSTDEKLIDGKYAKRVHRSLFIGGAVVDHPPFLVAIVLDEPEYGVIPGIGRIHHGGSCAAPIFRQVCQRSLSYLNIPPDDPFGYPVGDPRYDSEKAAGIQANALLQEKYALWNSNPVLR